MRQNETQVLLKSIDAYVEGLYAPLDAALENASGARAGPGCWIRPFSFSTYAVG